MDKCAACGYQKDSQYFRYEKVMRYKSGKKKGEIKNITTETFEVDKNKPNFVPLYFRKEVDEVGFDVQPYSTCFIEAKLHACPECGTVQVKNIDQA